ncbi:MAG: MoaD/ThiS family protein [Pirellulales bacterium]
MAQVFIPSQWRDLTGGVSAIEIAATTLDDVVSALEARFPGIAARLVNDGTIAAGLAVSIDGSVTSRGLLAEVPPNAEVHFLPAIGGG